MRQRAIRRWSSTLRRPIPCAGDAASTCSVFAPVADSVPVSLWRSTTALEPRRDDRIRRDPRVPAGEPTAAGPPRRRGRAGDRSWCLTVSRSFRSGSGVSGSVDASSFRASGTQGACWAADARGDVQAVRLRRSHRPDTNLSAGVPIATWPLLSDSGHPTPGRRRGMVTASRRRR